MSVFFFCFVFFPLYILNIYTPLLYIELPLSPLIYYSLFSTTPLPHSLSLLPLSFPYLLTPSLLPCLSLCALYSYQHSFNSIPQFFYSIARLWRQYGCCQTIYSSPAVGSSMLAPRGDHRNLETALPFCLAPPVFAFVSSSCWRWPVFVSVTVSLFPPKKSILCLGIN